MSLPFVYKFIISALLVLFFAFQVDWSVLFYQIQGLNFIFMGLSVAFILGQIFFLNLRWHAYMNSGRENIPLKTSILINITGYFANILFITSIGGIVAKSTLAIHYGLSVVRALFITFLDRFMTLFALLILSAVALPTLSHIIDQQMMIMLSAIIVLSILGVLISVALMRSGWLKAGILSSRKRASIVIIMRNVLENYPLMGKTALYSVIAQMCFILNVYILSLGIEQNSSHTALEFLALMPILALISSLPISFGGWGVREGAFIYGLALIGFSIEHAFLLSIQVGFVTMIAPFIFGLPYFIRDEFSVFNKFIRRPSLGQPSS